MLFQGTHDQVMIFLTKEGAALDCRGVDINAAPDLEEDDTSGTIYKFTTL
jgi:hypothetical protein